eukprot:m.38791 g.38791  ORF g.38791 m.38791 type:complete len:98 (-) comp11209_c0_seq1:149-442(-)
MTTPRKTLFQGDESFGSTSGVAATVAAVAGDGMDMPDLLAEAQAGKTEQDARQALCQGVKERLSKLEAELEKDAWKYEPADKILGFAVAAPSSTTFK